MLGVYVIFLSWVLVGCLLKNEHVPLHASCVDLKARGCVSVGMFS